MKLINPRKHFKKSLLALSVCALMPAISSDVLAQKSEKERTQVNGYLGKLSQRAIEAGMLERLKSNTTSGELVTVADDELPELKDRVDFWHQVALNTVALDHTSVDDEGAPANQAGPTRTSRAMAMVQIAVFEAINHIDEDYENYIDEIDFNFGEDDALADSAVAQAAFTTLSALYPDHVERLTPIFESDLAQIQLEENNRSYEEGLIIGQAVAEAVLNGRINDRSDHDEPSFGEGGAVADGDETFFNTPVNGGTALTAEWQPDPLTPEFSGDYNLSLGAYWGAVTPFFLESGDQFRVPEPPLPGDTEYAEAYNEVAGLGGSPENLNTPSTSKEEYRFIGNYWGYDGVPLIGVPPRIYNQIASQISSAEFDEAIDYARFLALINIGMADTAIAAWDSKYYYNYWRPVTGIRVDDGTSDTVTDPTWEPIGVSVINTDESIRPTPPFPAYPSGHAAFGATVFEIMREFFGDDTAFTFVSDEFNGEGFDPFFPDIPRPLVPVRYESFTDAQLENGISRIYNGVHWSFDNTAGQEMGLEIADYLLNDIEAFQPENNGRNNNRRGNNNRGNNNQGGNNQGGNNQGGNNNDGGRGN